MLGYDWLGMEEEFQYGGSPRVREESPEERSARKQGAVLEAKTWLQAAGLLGVSEAEAETWELGEAWRKMQTDP
jgi:hypothetical protein